MTARNPWLALLVESAPAKRGRGRPLLPRTDDGLRIVRDAGKGPLPGRSLLFVACYLAARSRLPYRLAMNKAIAEFTRLTGEPMSVGAAKRILLDWRWEGVVPWWPWKSKGKPPPPRLRRFVMLPEFTDNPAPPVAPAMVFLDPEREYRCISTGRMVRLDPETIKLVKDMAPRSDAKVLFALSVKVGKPPRFPKMKPTIRRVSPGHLS